jgi:DNA polymerase III epsilon subunit-like protein
MSNQHPVKKASHYLSVKTQNANIVSAAIDSLAELNEGERGTRIVTAGMAKKVVLRSLELNANDTYSLRLHKALRDVYQFADMARSDTPLTASASNADLLPIAHPNSTRPNNMDYFDKKTLHARWYSDDPRVTDPNVLPLLASAFTSLQDTPEYKYSIARLSAMGPSEVTMQALVAAFKPGANDFFWLQQLRDGDGQFAKMFGFLSMLVRKAGKVFGLNSQVVSTNADNQTFVSETPDGKLVRTPAKSGKSIKAIIPSERTPDGYSKNPVPFSASDDITDEEDLQFVDSPDGWKKDEAWAPSQDEIDYYGPEEDLGTVFADEGDNYEVRKFNSPNEAAKNNFEIAQLKENDGQPVVAYGKGENGELDQNLPVYLVRRKDEGEAPFAAVQSWADVQQQVTADRSKYEKGEAPAPARPKSIGKAALSKLRVGNKVESEDVEGKGARIKGNPNANAFRVASYLKMLKRHKEQGYEFPIDPRREHFILDDGTIIDSETGIVVRDNKGNSDPDAWKKPPVEVTADQEEEAETDAPEGKGKGKAKAKGKSKKPSSKTPKDSEADVEDADDLPLDELSFEQLRERRARALARIKAYNENIEKGNAVPMNEPAFDEYDEVEAEIQKRKDAGKAPDPDSGVSDPDWPLDEQSFESLRTRRQNIRKRLKEIDQDIKNGNAINGDEIDRLENELDAVLAEIEKRKSSGAAPDPDAPKTKTPEAPKSEKEPVKVPNGYYDVTRSEYFPEGAVDGQTSPDFTDDPAQLAQVYSKKDLVTALAEAVKGTPENPATGFGQLPFDNGLEIVPAEALYKALDELGEDADAILDDMYLEGAGEPSPKIANEIVPALGEEVPAPPVADEVKPDNVAPPLIDGLTDEEKAPFVENGDYLPYLPENNVEVEAPEGYFPIDNEPWTPLESDIPQDAPDGFSVNPVDIANNYPNDMLIAELRRALEPGNPTPGYGILGIETPEGETYFANVPAEAIRDALQLQGVDTNELIDAIYEEGQKGQTQDEPTPDEIQDAIEGENVEEGQEPTVEPSQEETTPTPEEPATPDEAGPETVTPGISTGEPTEPAKLNVKTTDLKPGDISVSDYFTIEEIFADDESEAIKPGSFWVVGYYPGHATQKTKLWNADTEIEVFRNVTPPAKGDLPELSKPKPKEMDPEGKIYKDKELGVFVPKDAEARSKYLDLLDQYNKDLATAKAVWTDAPDVNSLPSWQSENLAAPNSPANPVGYAAVKATEVKPGDITFKKEWGSDFYEFFIVEGVEEKDGMAIVTGYYPGHVSQTKEWNATTQIEVMRGASDLPAPGTGPALSRPKKDDPDVKEKKEAFKAAKKLSAEGFTPPLDPTKAPALVDEPATAGEAATKPAPKPKSPAYPAFTGDRLKQIAAEANGDPVKFMELLNKEELMVLDFETAADGAFNKQTPIQVAWTKFKEGLGISTGTYWMNPEVPLGKFYTEPKNPDEVLRDPSGNVISDEWLANQPGLAEQMTKVLEKIGPDTILVIHNVPFDAQILKRYAEQLGIPYAPAGEIDTLALSRLVINGENGAHVLQEVAKRYGITPEGAWHDANTDTEVLYPILQKLMEEMGKTKQGIEALNVEANLEKYEADLAAYNASKNKKAIADTSLAVSKPIKDAFDGKDTLPTIDELIDSLPKELPNSEELSTATTPKESDFNDGDFAVQSVLGDVISNNWVDDDQNTTNLGMVQVENWKPGDFFKAVKGGWFEVIEITPDPEDDKRVFVKRRLLANGKDYLEVNPWIKKRPYEIRRRNGLVEEPVIAEAPATTPETSTPTPEATEKWNGYDIKQDSDGVFYAEGISGSDVQKLRNGQLTPPQLPFFAPMGGGNNTSKGDGYFFSTNGSRFWGKFGAAGALVRRKNNKGEYEYFLAKRSSGLSQGGGKWNYPGGAHKDKLTAEENNGIITAIDEFAEEVGGDLGADSAVLIGNFVNPVAPDWSYTTQIFEVGPNELTDLQPTDGENSETGWFTAQQINKMAEEGSLHSEFANTASTIFGTLNDEVPEADVPTPDAQNVESMGLGKSFDTSGWTKVSGQAGTNQGAFYVDPATGQQYYVKKAKSIEHASNEILASALYEQAGIPVGRAYFGTDEKGEILIVSPLVQGNDGTLGQIAPNQKIVDEIKKGFAVDAWLANFDVIGTNKDNILVKEVKPIRIDAGGAMLFRAQGESKAAEMDTNVSKQIDSMRDSKVNPQAASVFGDMTDAEIAESVKLVASIDEAKIDELVEAAFPAGDGLLSDPNMGAKLKENLKRRRKELIEQYNVQETTEPATTPEPQESTEQSTKLSVPAGDDESKVENLTAQIEKAIADGNDVVFNYNGKTIKLSPESVKEAKTGNVNLVGTLPSGQYRSFTLSKMEPTDGATPEVATPEAPERAPKLTSEQEMIMDALESEGIEVTPEEATKIVEKIENSNALDWSEADDPEVIQAIKDVDAVNFETKTVKSTPTTTPQIVEEPTAPATEAEKPTSVPEEAKAKLLEGLSNIAEAIFGKAANKEQLKSTLDGLKSQDGADVDLIDSIIADLDAPEPKPEPSTPAEKVAEDISQELFPEEPEIDAPEPLTPEEIEETLNSPDETDPELIWKAVKEDYNGTVLDNGHIVVSSVMHGNVRYDVVVRRTGQNSFAIYHRITNPDGSTKVYTLGSRLHSSKALNNKITAQINNSKSKPNYVKSKSKAETKDTLLPTSISAVPTTKEAYVSADGTVLKVGSKIKVVNPTHSKFGQTGTVTTLKKKIGADGSYVYTDYIKVKFEDGEKNQIVSQSVTPENSTWTWGDPTPPPKTDGDTDGGGTGGSPVTPPTPTTPAPAAPTPATPATPAAPSGLSETSTLADAEAVAVDKNSAMHTAYFGASDYSDYKSLMKKHMVKDASSGGKNLVPGIIVSNQSPDGPDPDLASYAVVTESKPQSQTVDVFYFDGPLKGTTASLANSSVWSREKFLTAEQGKELGADVNTSIRDEALKAQGEKAQKAQEAAVKKAEQEKIQKEADAKKAAIAKAKQDLIDVDTDIGPGVEAPTTEGPADWNTSAAPQVPSLQTVLSNINSGTPLEAANGGQVLIDAGDIEDLKVRVHQVEKNGEKKIRLSFKLTSWAGNQLTKSFAQKDGVTSTDNARLPRFSTKANGTMKYEEEWAVSKSDHSNKGRTYKGELLGGQGEFQFIRANRAATNPNFFSSGTSSNGPISLHNRVDILLPADATPEQIAQAIEEIGGVKSVKPATAANVKVVAENKIITLFGQKADGAKNYKGNLRAEILKNVQDNYGFTADDMELRVDTQQKGLVQYLLPEKVAKQLDTIYGAGFFKHNWHSSNLPSDPKKRADFVYNLLFKTGGGLYSTAVRWSEGVNTNGTSSWQDLRGQGGNYVFTRKVPDMDLASGSSYGSLSFYFDGVKMLQHPELYGSTGDDWGQKSESQDYLSLLKNSTVQEVLFKENLSWADLSGIALDSDARVFLLNRLTNEGITEISGKSVNEMFGVSWQ